MVHKFIKIVLTLSIACQTSMIGAAEASYVSEYAQFNRSKNMMPARQLNAANNVTAPVKPTVNGPDKLAEHNNRVLSPIAWGFVVTLITVSMCLILLLYFACITMTDIDSSKMDQVDPKDHKEMIEIASDDEA